MDKDVLIRRMHIVIIDDDDANVALLKRILLWADFSRVTSFRDPTEALQAVQFAPPDVVLLDLNLPKLTGFQVLSELRSGVLGECHIPIIIFTADTTPETRIKALGLGATEFLTKPGEASEILLRIRNALEMKYLHGELRRHNLELESLVKERTGQLALARLDALKRLAITAEFRDDDTGEHARRVGLMSANIAKMLKCPSANPQILELAAPLHDIGKVAIPDAILLKPGKLTPDEFEVMKTHTTIGAQILGDADSELFTVAASIALSHHEKWNGGGYPQGLSGEAIPLVARIVGVADVFDALTHKRVYKDPWTVQEAANFIQERAGMEFDPTVVHAFKMLSRTTSLKKAA